MYSITELRTIVENEIAEQKYHGHPTELYDPINYMMGLGGKRMRPVLLLMGYNLFNTNINAALKAALAIEVFHNFTLMHDDIMDKAPIRRGKSTVHEKWNPNIAILSGDVMLVEAYKLLMHVDESKLKEILELFNKTAVEVCEGQQLDMNFENMDSVKVEEYIRMIELKTAVLLAAALKIGAILGDASNADANHIYEFGRHLGIAFQLQDDILDVYGDPEKFGKLVGGDIITNKKTFLLINALALAKGANQQELKHWISLSFFNETEKVNAIKRIYDELNLRELANVEMTNHVDKAFLHLRQIAAPSANKIGLEEFANQLSVREN